MILNCVFLNQITPANLSSHPYNYPLKPEAAGEHFANAVNETVCLFVCVWFISVTFKSKKQAPYKSN